MKSLERKTAKACYGNGKEACGKIETSGETEAAYDEMEEAYDEMEEAYDEMGEAYDEMEGTSDVRENHAYSGKRNKIQAGDHCAKPIPSAHPRHHPNDCFGCIGLDHSCQSAWKNDHRRGIYSSKP
jgi:hypothetical protein